MRSIDPNSILIDRPARQRRELTGIRELADSIAVTGQIQPIVLRDGNVLVAGERRLEACKLLGTNVLAIDLETCPPDLAQLIELEENVKREELPWLDRADAIRKIAQLLKAKGASTVADVAAKVGLSENVTTTYLTLAAEHATNPTNPIFALAAVGTASSELARQRARKADAELEKVRTVGAAPVQTPTGGIAVKPIAAPAPPMPAPQGARFVSQGDFIEWASRFSGPRFNLIHCDFPYGVNATGGSQISATLSVREGYDDAEDIYWALLAALCRFGDNFIADSAHMLFWFSMKHYSRTVELLSEAGWWVNPHPLIWLKSDNAGILQDHNRVYRNIYETALFASRGDRLLVKAKSNAIAHPRGETRYHVSEKPLPVLSHFLSGLVDNTTRLFDPTAGSGAAILAGLGLGAAHATGLELDPVHAETANARIAAEWSKEQVNV